MVLGLLLAISDLLVSAHASIYAPPSRDHSEVSER